MSTCPRKFSFQYTQKQKPVVTEEVRKLHTLLATAPKLLDMLEKIYDAEFEFGCWPTRDEVEDLIAEAKGEKK